MRGLMVGLALGAVMLAACSKPAANATNTAAAAAPATPTAAAAAPAAAAGPAGAITLAELPAPTAGAWSRVSSQDGAAAETSTKCLDGKPIDPTDGLPMKCAKWDVQRTATGGFVAVGDCPNNGMTAKLTLAGEGDFAKAFTTDSTMVMTGGPGGDMTTKNHSAWTFVGGACAKS